MCLISVVIPAYKGLNYILNAVESVKSDLPYEIIIVIDDDDSIDTYYDKVKLVENIKIFKNKKNMGVTFSRNKGYFQSKGEIIVFLDVDDLLTVSLDKIWDIVNLNHAEIYFFRCVNDFGFIVGESAAGEGSKVVFTEEMINMNNKGERLLVLRRKSHSYPPFLGQTRGHEMAGLIRFLDYKSTQSLFYSDITARKYTSVNVNSLSRLRSQNSIPISIGHFVVFKFLANNKKIKSIFWLIKAIYRRYTA